MLVVSDLSPDVVSRLRTRSSFVLWPALVEMLSPSCNKKYCVIKFMSISIVYVITTRLRC